jgi:hypothetical protein
MISAFETVYTRVAKVAIGLGEIDVSDVVFLSQTGEGPVGEAKKFTNGSSVAEAVLKIRRNAKHPLHARILASAKSFPYSPIEKADVSSLPASAITKVLDLTAATTFDPILATGVQSIIRETVSVNRGNLEKIGSDEWKILKESGVLGRGMEFGDFVKHVIYHADSGRRASEDALELGALKGAEDSGGGGGGGGGGKGEQDAYDLEYAEFVEERNKKASELYANLEFLSSREASLSETIGVPVTKPTITWTQLKASYEAKDSKRFGRPLDVFGKSKVSEQVPIIMHLDNASAAAARAAFPITNDFFTGYITNANAVNTNNRDPRNRTIDVTGHSFLTESDMRVAGGAEIGGARSRRRPRVITKILSQENGGEWFARSILEISPSPTDYNTAKVGTIFATVIFTPEDGSEMGAIISIEPRFNKAKDGAFEFEVTVVRKFTIQRNSGDKTVTINSSSGFISQTRFEEYVLPNLSKAFPTIELTNSESSSGKVNGEFSIIGAAAERFVSFAFYHMAVVDQVLRTSMYINESATLVSEKKFVPKYTFGTYEFIKYNESDQFENAKAQLVNIGNFSFDVPLFVPTANPSVAPALLPITFTAISTTAANYLAAFVSVAVARVMEFTPSLVSDLKRIVPKCCKSVGEELKTITATKTTTTAKGKRGTRIAESVSGEEINTIQHSKIADLHAFAPASIVPHGYSSKCLCKSQPVVIAADEVADWERDGYKPIEVDVESGGKNLIFVCLNKHYAALVKKTEKGGGESIQFPCCFQSPQKGGVKEQGKTSSSLTKTGKEQKLDYIITRPGPIGVNRIGLIPRGLARVLRSLVGGKDEDFVRFGGHTTGNSAIHAVLQGLFYTLQRGDKALVPTEIKDLVEEYGSVKDNDATKAEEIAIRVRGMMTNAIPASTYAQEFPDLDHKSSSLGIRNSRITRRVRESLSLDNPIDTLYHIRGLEAVLGVNIFVFASDEQYPGNFEPEIPNAAIASIPPCDRDHSKYPCIFLLRHHANFAYETIISRGVIAEGGGIRSSAELGGFASVAVGGGKGVFNGAASEMASRLFTLTAPVSRLFMEGVYADLYSSTFRMYEMVETVIKNGKITAQEVDSYGKLRTIVVEPNGESEWGPEAIVIETPPLAPLRNVPFPDRILSRAPRPFTSEEDVKSVVRTSGKREFRGIGKVEITKIERASGLNPVFIGAISMSQNPSFNPNEFSILALPQKRSGKELTPLVIRDTQETATEFAILFVFWARSVDRARAASMKQVPQDLNEWFDSKTRVISETDVLPPPNRKNLPATFPDVSEEPFETPSQTFLLPFWNAFFTKEGDHVFFAFRSTASREVTKTFLQEVERNTIGIETNFEMPFSIVPREMLGVFAVSRDFHEVDQDARVFTTPAQYFNWAKRIAASSQWKHALESGSHLMTSSHLIRGSQATETLARTADGRLCHIFTPFSKTRFASEIVARDASFSRDGGASGDNAKFGITTNREIVSLDGNTDKDIGILDYIPIRDERIITGAGNPSSAIIAYKQRQVSRQN